MEPAEYFHTIGISRIAAEGLLARVEQLLGPSVAASVQHAFDGIDPDELFRVSLSDLQLHKLILGTDLQRLCLHAEVLGELEMNGEPSVLDIGGGAGAIPLWLSTQWTGARFTVADPNGAGCGQQWAAELGLGARMQFMSARLPELIGVSDRYDIVLLTACLEFLPGFEADLPDSFGPRWWDYKKNPKAAAAIDAFTPSAAALAQVLEPDGLLVIVETWTEAKLQILAAAMASVGLSFNLEISNIGGRWGTTGRVALAHDDAPNVEHAFDVTTLLDLHSKPVELTGSAAAAVRELFGPAERTYQRRRKDGSPARVELCRQPGLCLEYETTPDGDRTATIYSGAAYHELAESVTSR